MKNNNKAKWIIGITGTAFSAFVLGQINDVPTNTTGDTPTMELTDSMSKEEKKLAKLDWNNFTIEQNIPEGNYSNDRTTRRT